MSQKIIVMRHECPNPQQSDDEYKALAELLREEAPGKKIEVYSSLGINAYNTGFKLTTAYLRDRIVPFPQDHLKGIGPYKGSTIEGLIPFPLLELTYHMAQTKEIHSIAHSILNQHQRGFVDIGLVSLTDDQELLGKIRSVSLDKKDTDFSTLQELVTQTENHVLFISHGGMVEKFPQAWGYEAPLLLLHSMFQSHGEE